METESQQPLLRLVPRSDDGPSRIVVASRAGRRPARLPRAWSTLILRGLALARALGEILRMVAPPVPDDLLEYVPKRDKVVEGALFLLQRASEEGVALSSGAMKTAMYLADKWHLDAHDRPVFFDNYRATADGPAGEAASDMLDTAFDWSQYGAETAPWIHGGDHDADRLSAARAPNMRRLSRSDANALEGAFAAVASLNAGQLRSLTHRQIAYVSAWRNGAGDGTRMDPRLIPERRDDEMIDDLLYASRHAFVARSRA